jgi:hypothetical protein
MTLSPAAEQIIFRLTDPTLAVEPRAFPADRAAAGRRGMYSWWADDAGRTLLGEELEAELPPLIYVGQAGATKWPSGRRSTATLGSRIGGNHIRGNIGSSTFRLTISALLQRRLALVALPAGRLDASSNRRVSDWIAAHLRVAVAPYDDRDTLGAVEQEVVATLDAPLNLGHCLPSRARVRLKALRGALRHP